MTSSSILQIMTDYEQTKLLLLYNEKKQLNNKISFTDFCSIIKTLTQISSTVIQSFIDSLRKEIKTKTNIDNESGIMINQSDYFKYLQQLIIENNRYLNQRDPELFELFKLLTGEERDTITKRDLKEILMTFDIPIEYDSFFAYVDKKEELAFNDFCALFKPNEKKELFIKTFAKNFQFGENSKSNEHIFPISISKRKI